MKILHENLVKNISQIQAFLQAGSLNRKNTAKLSGDLHSELVANPVETVFIPFSPQRSLSQLGAPSPYWGAAWSPFPLLGSSLGTV